MYHPPSSGTLTNNVVDDVVTSVTLISHFGHLATPYPSNARSPSSITLKNINTESIYLKFEQLSARILEKKRVCLGELVIQSEADDIKICPELDVVFNEWVEYKVKGDSLTFKFTPRNDALVVPGFSLHYRGISQIVDLNFK